MLPVFTLPPPQPVAFNARAAMTNHILASFGVSPHEAVNIVEADDNFAHGRVTAFNASQFSGNNPHEFLSNFAVRYSDPNGDSLDSMRAFIAPDVPVPTLTGTNFSSQFVEYPVYNFADALLSNDNLDDDLRAIGADFNTLRNPQHQLVTQRISNRGLAVEVDEDEERLDTDWQQQRVAYLRGILDRNRLRRTVAGFVAGAVAVTKNWYVGANVANTFTATCDPDQDILDELEAQSVRSTRVLYGPAAWQRRSRAYKLKNDPGGYASIGMSLADLAGMLAMSEARVLRNKYATGATAATNILGSVALMFVAQDGMNKSDYSNMKTFWGLTKTGQRYAAYVRQVGDKRWRIAVECYDLVTVTAPGLGMEVVNVTSTQPA